jgi:hypothetical protein
MLRRILQVTAVITTVAGLGVVGAGCLDRPITSNNPTTKTNFTTAQQASTIDKVDLLFDIDNSASMGDKQFYLEQAVPDLINRLINPNCNNTSGVSQGSSNFGDCSGIAGTTVEFPPVHNMHIGIISSSLGTRGVDNGGQVCDPNNPNDNNTGPFLDMMPGLPTHVDDRGELLNRTATGPEEESTSPDVGGQYFLDWFPTNVGGIVVQANEPPATATGGITPVLSPLATPLTATATLESDFQALVAGVHTYGCGIESQLETWYRFLIQPDPYDSISTSGGAQWVGVDATIIQQRHDFLRPDSLVAIIVLSDENDSEIDVRSFGGQGWSFMDEGPPAGSFQPPRGTAICLTDPASPDCTSCAYNTPATKADKNCQMGPYTAENDWGFYINVRHVHMQQKYGIIPQFPLQRYVLGLTSPKVPDRTTEYPSGASSYQGGTNQDPQDLNCTNPLYALTLPDGSDLTPATLCNANAMAGPRSTNLVFYAHIGGVPHQLLQTTPGEKDAMGNLLCPADAPCDAATGTCDCPQKDTLAVSDWTKILGQGPATGGSQWDYTGIDPHMIENYDPPRTGTAYNTGATETILTGTPSTSGGGPDPINGRDWTTDSTNPSHVLPVDREYACIFPLVTPRDCSKGNSDPVNSYACDCELPTTGGNWYTSPSDVPSVCGLPTPAEAPSATNDFTTQYYAKTYPTIRELSLAQMMGQQGIISSLCPIHVQEEGAGDPLYGYRPAITAIVNRLKNALASQCLPQPLTAEKNEAGQSVVPCLVLATIPNTVGMNAATVCGMHSGLSVPNAQILQTFNQNQDGLWMSDMVGPKPSTLVTCEVQQLTVAAMPTGGTTSGTCVGPTASYSPAGDQGWCYVTGTASGACDTQAILFTQNALPNGATVNLQCILANQGNPGGGSGDGG